MNFEYFKQMVNSLPDTVKTVEIVLKDSGNSYIFEISLDDEHLFKSEKLRLNYSLQFKS